MALLEIHRLRKAFPAPEGGLQTVVDVPEFVLEEQAQMALHGRSGCGKTTFLNLIAGILVPDKGEIRFRNRDIATLSEAERDRLRAASMGYIFQSFHLLQGYTCLENVILGMSFGGRSDPNRAGELLRRMDLGHRMQHYPRQLSTGQQQRVAVARALASRPRLVLADEPTGNLDRAGAHRALDLIRNTCQENGAALLLASHDPAMLDRFDLRTDFVQINRSRNGTDPA